MIGSMRIDTAAAPVREKVVSALRLAITSGRFEPGQRLLERELCDLMGVSRSSVREALRQLESEHLIESIPNRGPVVAQLSEKDARDIYEVRAALESEAARLFAQAASDADIASLQEAFDALTEAYSRPDLDKRLEAKSRFYDVLFAGSGNAMIPAILRSMNDRVALLRRVSLSSAERLPESIYELRVLVQFLKSRDPVGAGEASRKHVIAAQNNVLAQLRANGGDRRS